MDADVPLLIPEANADHLTLIDRQQKERGWSGAILANPNCSTAALALALAPLHRAFGVERLFVSTMQAVSGAGYPGVASLDIVGNVIPHIGGEEEKIERESRKILGTLSRAAVEPAQFAVSAHTNRVAVVDGHMMTVSVGFSRRVRPDEALAALRDFRGRRRCGLPSSPNPPIEVDIRSRPAPAPARPGSWRRHGCHRGPGAPLPHSGPAAGRSGPQHCSGCGGPGRPDRGVARGGGQSGARRRPCAGP